MSVATRDQTALDEQVVENSQLEQALDERERAKVKKTKATKDYQLKDGDAKAQLEELDLADDAIIRVGRFRIKKTAVPSRSVSFETDPTSRLTIGVISDD